MDRFKSFNFYYTLLITAVVSVGAKYLATLPALKLFGHLSYSISNRYGVAVIKIIKSSN